MQMNVCKTCIALFRMHKTAPNSWRFFIYFSFSVDVAHIVRFSIVILPNEALDWEFVMASMGCTVCWKSAYHFEKHFKFGTLLWKCTEKDFSLRKVTFRWTANKSMTFNIKPIAFAEIFKSVLSLQSCESHEIDRKYRNELTRQPKNG